MVKLLWLALGFLTIGCQTRGKNATILPILGETTEHPITGDTLYYKAPHFNLIDQEDKTITQNSFAGKIQVVDFFFTSCPTICPQMTSHLKEVQEHFRDDGRVAIISYSIDTTTDTPQRLSRYAESNNIDPVKWSLLTGDGDAIFELSKGYKVMAFDDSSEETPNLVHDGTFVLLDHQRRIRGYYNGLDKKDTYRMINDMEKLLKTM